MSASLTFTVPGIPRPKGSSRAVTYRRAAAKGGGIGARVLHDNDHTAAWCQTVGQNGWLAARALEPGAKRALQHDAVEVTAVFYLPRPKDIRDAGAWHIRKPDVDKLLRALLDGLTQAGIYADDAQVIRVVGSKHYAHTADDVRAVVTVSTLERPLFLTGD